MGKRSSYERRPNDFYQTFDKRAADALAPHLTPGSTYAEPCAGDGSLIDLLMPLDILCVHASDYEPQTSWIIQADALETVLPDCDLIITNPPWSRPLLHALIVTLCSQAPTWMLFDADWMQTRQSAAYMRWCVKIVAIGRLRWIPRTTMDGKDNCCWYLFDMRHDGSPPVFIPRAQLAASAATG